jgi:uncharacterized membrane protein
MSFTEVMEWVSRGFEIAGIIVLIVGFLLGAARALQRRSSHPSETMYDLVRQSFGRTILLGLEILVAADLVRTVAVDQTWQNVLALGLLVLIRTFLSFSLEVEMDGVWPWRRGGARTAGADAAAAGESEPTS